MSDASSPDCHPLTLTRDLRDFPIGNLPLQEHQRETLVRAGLSAQVHPHAWLDPGDAAALRDAGARTLVDAGRQPLLWVGEAPDPASVHVAVRSFVIRFPWDLLRANEQFVASLPQSVLHGEVHPSAVVEGVLQLGTGTRILPGVFIEGNVVIGKNAKIGPNCYLRGNTSIGDGCHIGQSVEIKNCLILSRTNVGHLSYVGDSVLGEQVNLGAGTIVANLRHDGANHRSQIAGELRDTGRRKFGAIVGDHVHTGIHTSIYPGRKLWPDTSTLPGAIVRRDLLA